jgi:hypothetical protein
MLRFAGVSTGSALLLMAVLPLASAPALADDITTADRLVCAASTVIMCWEDGECETGSPLDLNIPQFIEIDLTQKRLSTTKASGLNRSTPIARVERSGGRIVLQGFENGRAFSYVLQEKTGTATVAVAFEGISVTAFGACTPASTTR